MAPTEIRGPDLSGVVAAANEAGLEHVVIGGFAVIAHGYFRATKDSDLLVPDGPEADQAILRFLYGAIDVIRGGLAPLDYETVAANSIEGSWRNSPFRVASLRSLVGFKRLAGRGSDRVDLEKLELANGELPIDPIPGLDT
jgi:hypothetical protein